MPRLLYWTVPYVALESSILGWCYYFGTALVIAYFCVSLVTQQTYMETIPVHGLARPRVRWSKSEAFQYTPESQLKYCEKVSCRRWDAEEVGEDGVDKVFLATRIKEVYEESKCQEPGCMYGFEKLNSSKFFVQNIEDFPVILNANAQAYKFASEHPNCSLSGKKGTSAVEQQQRLQNDELCPYAGSNKHLRGVLLNTKGEVLRELPPGQNDELPLSVWLEAANIRLDDQTDLVKPNRKLHEGTYRFKGVALMVTIDYLNKDHASIFDSFRGNPPSLHYRISVQHLAETGFKHKTVLEQRRDPVTNKLVRHVQTRNGVLFKIQITGEAGRFSWSAVMAELVLKLGLITLLGTVTDIIWMYILPMLGLDYNPAVFRTVTKQEALKKKNNANQHHQQSHHQKQQNPTQDDKKREEKKTK